MDVRELVPLLWFDSPRFDAGLMIRPGKLDIVFNKSDPKDFQSYVAELDGFLHSRQRSSLSQPPIIWKDKRVSILSVNVNRCRASPSPRVQ